MTAVAAARVPKRRMALLLVVALVVSAVAASATAVALGSRAELSSSRRRVDAAWSALRPSLTARYNNLGQAAGVARARLNANRTVFDDITKAVADWPGTARWPTDRQVAAAAHLEGLAARLSATVATTPRLRAADDVAAAMRPLEETDTAQIGVPYNAAVSAYQKARGGFPRRLVAGALGYEDRRTLEVPA
ncbi:MAG: LemA family protein [Actinomycetota bacterium]|nr:LemA family protein [Actinomycetota bacterium]